MIIECKLIAVDFDDNSITLRLPLAYSASRFKAGSVKCDIKDIVVEDSPQVSTEHGEKK